MQAEYAAKKLAGRDRFLVNIDAIRHNRRWWYRLGHFTGGVNAESETQATTQSRQSRFSRLLENYKLAKHIFTPINAQGAF
jgi:hypothetical protein